MSSCTFFGHRNSSEEYIEPIKEAVEKLIVEKGVDNFYVGNNGGFDFYSLKVLREMKKRYDITYSVVIAYLPEKKEDLYYKESETIYPEGIENVPKRVAISWRNKWMVNKSDYVISGVHLTFGGAYDSVNYAMKKRQKKTIISVIPKNNTKQ